LSDTKTTETDKAYDQFKLINTPCYCVPKSYKISTF